MSETRMAGRAMTPAGAPTADVFLWSPTDICITSSIVQRAL